MGQVFGIPVGYQRSRHPLLGGPTLNERHLWLYNGGHPYTSEGLERIARTNALMLEPGLELHKFMSLFGEVMRHYSHEGQAIGWSAGIEHSLVMLPGIAPSLGIRLETTAAPDYLASLEGVHVEEHVNGHAHLYVAREQCTILPERITYNPGGCLRETRRVLRRLLVNPVRALF